jgi:hypothetical protein
MLVQYPYLSKGFQKKCYNLTNLYNFCTNFTQNGITYPLIFGSRTVWNLLVFAFTLSSTSLPCCSSFRVLLLTSRKKGFHSPPLVPKLFDPRLKEALVPVHSKMWAMEH